SAAIVLAAASAAIVLAAASAAVVVAALLDLPLVLLAARVAVLLLPIGLRDLGRGLAAHRRDGVLDARGGCRLSRLGDAGHRERDRDQRGRQEPSNHREPPFRYPVSLLSGRSELHAPDTSPALHRWWAT